MIAEKTDEFFMSEALKEARKAYNRDEVPVGAVVVCKGQIIARAHNLTETLTDVTAHAEMQAFTAASDYLGGKYLNECTLYVSLEPCIMCAGASYWAQLGRLVFGAKDEKRGYSAKKSSILHPKTKVTAGMLEKECSQLISDFFKQKRQ
jgi:tRNA(adenine34) deaminase